MKNLIHTAVVTLFAASAAHAQQAVQWRVEDGGNGHWYLVSAPESRTWQSWHDLVTAFGGHLATVTSAAERDFIQPSVRNMIPLNRGAVLGARQDRNDPTWSEPSGGWQWVTGEPWSWTNWTTFEANPSNSSSGECSCEDHLSLGRWAVTEDGVGNWNDYNGNNTVEAGAIIEWSADCNNDGIVDYGQCRDGSLPDYNGNNVPDCCEAGESCVTNMLRNGSFEIGPTQGCGWICLTTGDDRLVGWDVTLNSVDRERTEPGGCNENWFASHGNYSIDMNGCSVGGIIRQFVPTEVGARYELSFDLSLNPANVAVGRLRASAGDASVIFEYARRSENPQPNEHHRMEFTATSQMTEVTFESLNREYSAQWNGPVVDSARMIPAVPTAPTCVDADIYRDFNVNGADLGILLSQWGPNTPLTESDLNKDGFVNGADLGILLSFWGACP